MPRFGEVSLAQVIAEVGPLLTRARDLEEAGALVGATPVAEESGKGRAVNFRWALRTGARQALSIFADIARHSSPSAAQLYAHARARGEAPPSSIRILMRAWLRVMRARRHSESVYGLTIRGAERRLAQHEIQKTAAWGLTWKSHSPRWSPSQRRMPPRIPAALSTILVRSSISPSSSRRTRRALPPPR